MTSNSNPLEEKLVKRAAHMLGIDRLFSYRRFNADHLQTLVRDGVVRFSNPANFNDPWECRPLFSLSSLDSESGRERAISWMQQAVVNEAVLRNRSPPSDQIMRGRADELRNNPNLLRALVEQSTEAMATALRAEYRVLCLTTTPDSPLMWSHYADHHRGFCLQFGAEGIFRDAYRVDYSTTYPEFDIADEDDYAFVIASILTKAKVWEYESEFRSINKEGGMYGFPECRDGFVTIPREYLQAVILGCQIDNNSQKTVEKIIETAGRKINLLKASLVPGHYKLDIKPL